MTTKNILKTILLVLIFNTAVFGQCNLFTKTKCLPKLKPYLNTQQLTNTILLSGDKTQLTSTFYYGDEYRLLICAQEQLGKIQLNIRDAQNNIIFTTKGYGVIMWDFNVESTQDLTLEVITPPLAANETIDKSGCVSILMGFK
ncbi:MAG: hypothetical protein ACT4ON_03320 [Bacteroidota bacterium]